MKIVKRVNKDGTTSWTTVLAMPRDPVNGQRKQQRITAHTRREVEQEVARIRNELRTGTYLEPTKLTVGEYLEQWLAGMEATVRPQTIQMYRRICRKRIGVALGSIPLASLSPLHIQNWYTAQHATGLTTTTVRIYHVVFHGALQRAVRLRLIPSNPADAVEQPKRRHTEMKTWDAAQVRAFLDSTTDDPLGAMWRLVAMTGLRQGEVLALNWDDVDLDRATLAVRRG